MLTSLLLIMVAMFARDLMGASYTVAVAANRPIKAALFDIGQDIASVLSLGVGGVEAVQHGISWNTVLVFAFMSLGSLFGTIIGTRLGHRE